MCRPPRRRSPAPRPSTPTATDAGPVSSSLPLAAARLVTQAAAGRRLSRSRSQVTQLVAITSVGRHAAVTDGVVVVECHIRAGDGATLHAPMLEDRGVVAVVHDVLDRVRHGLLQWAALDQGNAVGRDTAGLARELQLAVCLRNLIARDGLVEPSELGPAGHQR